MSELAVMILFAVLTLVFQGAGLLLFHYRWCSSAHLSRDDKVAKEFKVEQQTQNNRIDKAEEAIVQLQTKVSNGMEATINEMNVRNREDFGKVFDKLDALDCKAHRAQLEIMKDELAELRRAIT